MTSLVSIVSGILIVATSAVAQPSEMAKRSEPVRIEVAPERLAECRETLAQVGLKPVPVDATATRSADPELPAVICVAIKA